ncbi:MAG: PIN domain-containing protein [Candidatus Binatia bacterium]
MSEDIRQLINRYRRAGILIDTNVLLLYFVGNFDINLIPQFKRTLQFTVEDYQTLLLIIRQFQKIVTTPNILTEVSNLSGQLPEQVKRPTRSLYFKKFAEGLTILEEQYRESLQIANGTHFTKLGLTDAGIFGIAKDKYLVLTDDFRLSQTLQKDNIDCLNFNHVRPLGWSNR